MAMDVRGMKGPIGIVGMGRTGQSVVRFLRARNIECIGFDEAPRTVADVPLVVGPLEAADFGDCRRLIVSPGIDWRHPALERARRQGIAVGGDLDVFSAHYQGEILAVTGTNGKTTTVTLIQTMLDTLPGGIEAAGNIGRPMLDLLDMPTPPRRVVLELSSFQLERATCLHPRWAALLNVQPDHADMHRDMRAYEAAKLSLFAHQREGDRALLPMGARWDALHEDLRARGVRVARFGEDGAQAIAGLVPGDDGYLFWTQEGERQRVARSEIRLCGRHQQMNLAVAAQAAADYGVAPVVIREAVCSFRGLAHRLQWVGHALGHDWYDDSKATNPAAAMAALGEFARVIWIC
ncbi:MAG: UDP-N-acetylmuramoyl-L-alanine--D-glutamate ligase, partial [Zetaproteobacteria bacterium]